MFYGLFGYFMNIWYVFCSFGAVLVSCPKINLATLVLKRCAPAIQSEQERTVFESGTKCQSKAAVPGPGGRFLRMLNLFEPT
jgi:hypothetical protein